MKLSRILRPHDKDCHAKGTKHEWSGVLKGNLNPFWGNHTANMAAKTGRHHLWYIVACNDPKCNGEKAVHSSVLADA